MSDFIPDNEFIADGSEAPLAAPTAPPIAATTGPITQATPIPAPTTSTQTPDFIPDNQFEADEDKYGGFGETVKAGLEGAAEGLAGPLAPAAERLLGVKDEDIRGRAEQHPWVHGAAELTTLVGGSLAGVGLGGTLAKIGAAAETASKGYGIGKIGSSIIKHAAENLVYQGQNEVSKLILRDPEQSAHTAFVDMGLAGLIGGAFGTISPLWQAAAGTKTGQMLGTITKKLGGIEGVVPTTVDDAIVKTGAEIAPEIRARLSDDPHIQQWAKTLEQSDTTKAGIEYQKSYEQARENLGQSIIGAFGKTAAEVDGLGSGLSKYEAGKALATTAADELDRVKGPLGEIFDGFKNQFKDVELDKGIISNISDRISQTAIEEGWTASPSSDIMREVNRIVKELPLQKNLKNLSDYITQVGNNTMDPLNGPLRRAGGMIRGILKDAESNVIGSRLGAEGGAEAAQAFEDVRAGYKDYAGLTDALDDRLHLKGSASAFPKMLREMGQTDGEAVLRRLSGSGDANLLQVLKERLPQTAEALKQYHINDLLGNAATKAKGNFTINSEALISKLSKMSPELRNFVAGPETQAKVEAVSKLLEEFNRLPHNFSNTARTLDKLGQHGIGTAMGILTALTGHTLAAPIVGMFGKVLAKDAPDAIKLGLLKFLGSSQPIDSAGFKSMIDLVHHTIKGESALSKATKAVVKGGSEVVPAHLLSTQKDRDSIETSMQEIKDRPDTLLTATGKAGHYMPEHAQMLSQAAATAVQHLDGMRPNTAKRSTLDAQPVASAADKATYNRALDIAQQPLTVLKHIKDGTLAPTDVQTLRTLYPGLYKRMSDKLAEHMVDAASKGETIPYKTRLGLSLFMGHALDSTMLPQSILAAQPQPKLAPNPAQEAQQTSAKRSEALNRLAQEYRTQGQSAEARRLKN